MSERELQSCNMEYQLAHFSNTLKTDTKVEQIFQNAFMLRCKTDRSVIKTPKILRASRFCVGDKNAVRLTDREAAS